MCNYTKSGVLCRTVLLCTDYVENVCTLDGKYCTLDRTAWVKYVNFLYTDFEPFTSQTLQSKGLERVQTAGYFSVQYLLRKKGHNNLL
jgi:hypothetical protein